MLRWREVNCKVKMLQKILKVEKSVSLSLSLSLCVSEYFSMCICVFTYRCPWRSKEGAGVAGICEAPHAVLVAIWDSLQEQQVLLITEPFPQLCFKTKSLQVKCLYYNNRFIISPMPCVVFKSCSVRVLIFETF